MCAAFRQAEEGREAKENSVEKQPGGEIVLHLGGRKAAGRGNKKKDPHKKKSWNKPEIRMRRWIISPEFFVERELEIESRRLQNLTLKQSYFRELEAACLRREARQVWSRKRFDERLAAREDPPLAAVEDDSFVVLDRDPLDAGRESVASVLQQDDQVANPRGEGEPVVLDTGVSREQVNGEQAQGQEIEQESEEASTSQQEEDLIAICIEQFHDSGNLDPIMSSKSTTAVVAVQTPSSARAQKRASEMTTFNKSAVDNRSLPLTERQIWRRVAQNLPLTEGSKANRTQLKVRPGMRVQIRGMAARHGGVKGY